MVLLQIFFWQQNNFVNWLLIKLGVQRNCAKFLGHPADVDKKQQRRSTGLGQCFDTVTAVCLLVDLYVCGDHVWPDNAG